MLKPIHMRYNSSMIPNVGGKEDPTTTFITSKEVLWIPLKEKSKL